MSYKRKEEAESDTCEGGREGKNGWEGRVSPSSTDMRKACKAGGESLGTRPTHSFTAAPAHPLTGGGCVAPSGTQWWVPGAAAGALCPLCFSQDI